MSVDRAWVLGELRKSLQALSRDGRAALESAPLGSCKADELALDYENFVSVALGSFADEFTPEQVSALRHVDDLLSAMSGTDHEDLWTDEAVCSHPRWHEIRSEARRAMTGLGWEE
jgi:hypothetical protein